MADKQQSEVQSTGTQPQQKGEGGGILPLFYKKPTALDSKAHVKLGLKKNFGFSFTKGVNAVPINMIEMPQICHFYPIAFSPDGNATPVAILGVRNEENLFVRDDGTWEPETYIPSYIRRYPFIFTDIDKSPENLVLCVDMDENVVEENSSLRFFDDEGKPSELSQNALEFCKSYHGAAQQTIEFSKALAKSGLLIEREAQVNVSGNRRINFSGFNIVDEKKLADMKDETFLEWRKKGWLPYIYAHLFSGAQWQHLTHLLNRRIEKEEAK